MKRFALAVCISITGVLAAAPMASAAVAGSVSRGGNTINYVATGNMSNRVTVTANTGTITITETAGTIVESVPACSGDGTNTVTCTDNGAGTTLNNFNLALGDFDDQSTASGNIGGNSDGEAGPDTLVGSDTNTDGESLDGGSEGDNLNTRNVGPSTNTFGFPVSDRASGDDGDDTVTTGNGDDDADGGDGKDVVSSGPGDDEVSGEEGDGDSVDAGPGTDFVYAFGSDGNGDVQNGGDGVDTFIMSGTSVAPPDPAFDNLVIDLAAGTASKTNNTPTSDTAAGFEDVDTGGGAFILLGAGQSTDTVTGTGGSNSISTGSFNDVVDPRAGADQVDLGPGDDRADGRDGFQDRFRCGPGNDAVIVDQFDEVADCEAVLREARRPAFADFIAPRCRLGGVRSRYTSARFRRGFTATLDCSEPAQLSAQLAAFVRSLRGRVITARVGQLTLAERNTNLTAGRQRVRLKPSRKLVRRLGRRFKARLLIDARDEFGNRSTIRKTIRVKPKKARKRKSRRRRR